MKKNLLISVCGLISACANTAEQWIALGEEDSDQIYYWSEVTNIQPHHDIKNILTLQNSNQDESSYVGHITLNCTETTYEVTQVEAYTQHFAKGEMQLMPHTKPPQAVSSTPLSLALFDSLCN